MKRYAVLLLLVAFLVAPAWAIPPIPPGITSVTISGSLVPKGAYAGGTAYSAGDSVSYATTNCAYVAIQSTTGNAPSNTTYWQVLACKGDTGSTGATGATGDTGAAGAAGTNGTNGSNGSNGAAGADGRTVLNGTSNPTSQGSNGDFYINTASWTIFGPKASGTWPSGTSLSGGATGSDVAYNASSWDANTNVPTKNVVRDYLETLAPSGVQAIEHGGTGATTWAEALQNLSGMQVEEGPTAMTANSATPNVDAWLHNYTLNNTGHTITLTNFSGTASPGHWTHIGITGTGTTFSGAGATMKTSSGENYLAVAGDQIDCWLNGTVWYCIVPAKISNTAYDATTWNNNKSAPTKDAVRDKFESLTAVPSFGTNVVAALGNTLNEASGLVGLAASPGTPDGTKFLRDDGTWVTAGACPVFQLIDGHGATTNLTSTNVTCPAMVDNTGQSGASASVIWPTRANNQGITLSVATTVATTYAFEIDFGAAVAYPNGNHTTAYRYCGYAATNVTEGNYGFAKCRRSSTYGSGGIACDWLDGVGIGGCHN